MAERCGFAKGLWGTYRQWQAEGAQVRKGEHGSTVVLWKQYGAADADRENDSSDAKGSHARIFARAFNVFNVEQVDGYESEPVAQLDEVARFAKADTFVANLGIDCVFGGDAAQVRASISSSSQRAKGFQPT